MKFFWWLLSLVVVVFLSWTLLSSGNTSDLSIFIGLPIIWAFYLVYTFGIIFSKKEKPEVIQMAKPMKPKKK